MRCEWLPDRKDVHEMERYTVAAALFLCLAITGTAAAHAQDLDAAGKKAYGTLKTAPFFAIGAVGEGGEISAGERAYRALLQQKQAVAAFEALLRDKNARVEGRLYALLGLRTRDRAAFARHLTPFLSSKAMASTMSGCMASDEPVAAVAKRIRKGEYR